MNIVSSLSHITYSCVRSVWSGVRELPYQNGGKGAAERASQSAVQPGHSLPNSRIQKVA